MSDDIDRLPIKSKDRYFMRYYQDIIDNKRERSDRVIEEMADALKEYKKLLRKRGGER
jgi:ribosome-binding protein aMBF1 (putative translation factor)